MKKKVKKTENIKIKGSISYVLSGIVLTSLSLGSILFLELIRYSFFIMLATVLVSVYYINGSLTSFYENKKMSSFLSHSGIFSLVLLSLFFGMQSSQLPMKNIFLVIGVVLLLIGLVKIGKRFK